MLKMKHGSQRGVIFIWVAVAMLVLIIFVGLSIDTGLITLVANQVQVGADAAALAGAQYVRSDEALARQSAVNVAHANNAARKAINLDVNSANNEGGGIVIGRYDRDTGTFAPQLANPNAVEVVVRLGGAGSLNEPLALAFGQIFGMETVNIQRRAIAMVGGGTGQGMIALSADDPKALYVRGSASVTVNDGSIQVNSSDPDAVDLQGSKFTVDAPVINIVGDIQMGGGDIGNTRINTDGTVVPDPLAYIPEPTWDAATDKGTAKISEGNYTLEPGYYSGGFSFSGGMIALKPGVYILGGAGFDISGGTNLSGSGVMFFIDSGKVSINGTGNIDLYPPNPETDTYAEASTYEGLLFFQARDNETQCTINGTAGLDLTGSLYFPKAHTVLSGTSDKVGSQFIADSIEIAGNSELTINYNGHLSAPGNRIYLVR